MTCSRLKDTIPINDAVKRRRRLYTAMEAAANVKAQLHFIQTNLFPGNEYDELIARADELSKEIGELYDASKKRVEQ